MRLFIFLIFLLFLISSSTSQRPPTKEDKNLPYSFKFRAVECENFDNSTAILTFCNVKSFSRTFITLNFGYEIFKPLNSLYVQLIALYRYGNIYREIVDTKVVDFCGAMSGTDFNPFMKMIFDIISKSIPKLFHKCPYEGKEGFYNITMDQETGKKWSIFPEGQYK
jgi:hypothetical protein